MKDGGRKGQPEGSKRGTEGPSGRLAAPRDREQGWGRGGAIFSDLKEPECGAVAARLASEAMSPRLPLGLQPGRRRTPRAGPAGGVWGELSVHNPGESQRVGRHHPPRVQVYCLYLGRHEWMETRGRKRLRRAEDALMEAQAMAACDSGSQERRELSEPESFCQENSSVIETLGGKQPSAETFQEDLRNEIQKMLEEFRVDMKQALLAKRKKFEMNTRATIKITNEKLDSVWKTHQEQRQNLYLKYAQQFQTLFREWDIDMKKAQEQEEKLARMFREQRNVLQQARLLQSQRLKKIKNSYEQFLKHMEELEKDHEHFLNDEQSEIRQGMAMLQDKIIVEAV
ncbi:synaptonemal complex protein 3-like [Muntiacus reevesi]|uniref:synaptonemal complex protein 3-like n=1 Tax=Muntiacus reevesi TaxID=9886 RepID=UPI0033075136